MSNDDRIGLAPRERSYVLARFLDDLDPALRDELLRLVRRRGAAAKRIAATLEPVELVFGGCDGRDRRIIACIEPPVERSGGLHMIEFGLRESSPTSGDFLGRRPTSSPLDDRNRTAARCMAPDDV